MSRNGSINSQMIEQFMKQDLNDNPFNNPLINQDLAAAADG